VKYSLIFILAGALGFFVFFKYQGRGLLFEHDIARLRIARVVMEVELSQNLGERELGLSGRQSLASGKGMLFIFPKPGLYVIWMKNMKFPIDIIWLDQNYKVIYIKENARPESYPETFSPPDLAQYVLETNIGFADKYQIKIGDQAEILK